MIEIMSNGFVNKLMTLPSFRRVFLPGALVFERNEATVSFYMVASGLVHMVRRQVDGAEFILQRATGGDVLAEASLTTTSYHCAAVAIEASELVVFSHSEVQRSISQDSEMAKAYVSHLGREVRNARLRAEIVSLRRVADRLDAWLAWNDNVLPSKGAWKQVAGEIGVSAEALYRELARRR